VLETLEKIRADILKGELSASWLRGQGWDKVGAALVAGGIGGDIRTAIMGVTTGTSYDENAFSNIGVTIVAGGGFQGVVGKATGFIAGERGPESVDIRPLSSSPGFQGGIGGNVQITFNVNAMDAKGVSGFLSANKDKIIDLLMSASLNGEQVLSSRGVTAEAAV
jgi:hypothetical protein